MSWQYILKDSKQVSRTVGGLDWENESIPEKEEDNCLKQLKEYYDKAKNHPYAIDKRRRRDGVAMNANYFKFSPIPEEVACAIVERIKSIKKTGEERGYRTLNIDGNKWYYTVRYGVFEKSDIGRIQKFRVTCMHQDKLVRFATYSDDLDANIDFR